MNVSRKKKNYISQALLLLFAWRVGNNMLILQHRIYYNKVKI